MRTGPNGSTSPPAFVAAYAPEEVEDLGGAVSFLEAPGLWLRSDIVAWDKKTRGGQAAFFDDRSR
jgi:hypothetical protein